MSEKNLKNILEKNKPERPKDKVKSLQLEVGHPEVPRLLVCAYLLFLHLYLYTFEFIFAFAFVFVFEYIFAFAFALRDGGQEGDFCSR